MLYMTLCVNTIADIVIMSNWPGRKIPVYLSQKTIEDKDDSGRTQPGNNISYYKILRAGDSYAYRFVDILATRFGIPSWASPTFG